MVNVFALEAKTCVSHTSIEGEECRGGDSETFFLKENKESLFSQYNLNIDFLKHYGYSIYNI